MAQANKNGKSANTTKKTRKRTRRRARPTARTSTSKKTASPAKKAVETPKVATVVAQEAKPESTDGQGWTA